MAPRKETPAANLPALSQADELKKMYEEMGLSPEEIEEILGLTGQNTVYNIDKTPVLKINKFGIDDVNGKSVKMGNFVLGQVAKEENGEVKEIEEIGEDYGPSPEITIIKFGEQFTYFPKNKDKKQICNSQIVVEPGEKAIGNKLGHECKDGTCPRRNKDLDKEDRCVCSVIAFCEVTNAAGEKKKALMYFKGTSFMPFQDYLKDAGKFPLFFAPTKLNTERKINGNNVYWIVKPELLKDKAYAPDQRMINFNVAKEINANVREFEAQRKLRNAEGGNKKGLPPGVDDSGVAPPGSRTVTATDADDIAF